MPAEELGLDLRLTDERCREPGGGGLGALGALLQGGTAGACGSRKARIVLTPAAAAAARRAHGHEQPAVILCVNPKCGRAIGDMSKLTHLLGLLR